MTPEENAESLREALNRVDRAADPNWKATADAMIVLQAGTKVPFTSLTLWEAGLPKPREGRALGPRFIAAKSRKIIKPTGRWIELPLDHEKSLRGGHKGRPALAREWVGV